jgi:hypothetical protein
LLEVQAMHEVTEALYNTNDTIKINYNFNEIFIIKSREVGLENGMENILMLFRKIYY